MSTIVRYPTSIPSRRMRFVTAAVLAALALAAPISSASTGDPQSRPDGGIQLSTPTDPYSPEARADGGIPLPSSAQPVATSDSSSGDGVDWGYFAIGGFVLLTLAGTAVLTRRRHVKVTPAH
jgi:hypothetical protein